MSNYATKSNVKNARGIDTSDFAKKADLANLKLNIVKLEMSSMQFRGRNTFFPLGYFWIERY